MNEEKRNPFVGYEYKEIVVSNEYASMYMDCYETFGWELDNNVHISKDFSMTTIRMKRDRKLVNKMELTRLQRQFEAGIREIQDLERSKNTTATIWALGVGTVGTVFMAGATFAATHTPPIWWLSFLCAVPAFTGWLCPWFLYRYKVRVQTHKVQPLIEEKHDEIYEVCKKAHSLL